ncbi:MAG: outer membrane lipid asymmetry maintenance protein MlaD [Deltaproteobacteria bacterium]|nr:MAG: outer membrane lipid asymmetry maintenance protein MlaD [Deltaproteobacteria bacterium]
MNQSRTELIVGIFVITGILCLGYLAIRLGKVEILGSGYVVIADFASVAGLKVGDAVEIAGVKVGRVESISLHDDRARLALRIDDSVKLPEDSIASVRARGLIGDKFIVISPGGSDKLLGLGGKIRETESPPDISEVIGKYLGGDLTSKSETKKGETK